MHLRRTPRMLAAALLWLAAPSQAAPPGQAAAAPVWPRDALDTNILFETVFPLNELEEPGWTPAQRKEIAYLLERIKKDDRVFLSVQAVVDPLGDWSENGLWAMDVARAVAARLAESGIRPDRMLVVPAASDASLFEQPRWNGFAALQRVVIRAFQGGDWLKRREAPTAVREQLPPEGPLRITAPAAGVTDRSRHVLAGIADPSVRTVSVVVGGEALTAAVDGGRFEIPVSLRPGENRIVVAGLDRFGRALRAARTVRYVPPAPTIALSEPAAGAPVDITRSPVITVRGKVTSRHPLKQAALIQNDAPHSIAIRPDGSFEQRAVLVTGEDAFSVEAVDVEGLTGISETRRVSARGIAERPLMAVLHWDEDDVDLDLHATDADGRHTFFDAPDVLESATAVPAGRLWLDDRDGYGPEVFTLENGTGGVITFAADYYRGKKPCRAYLTLVIEAGSPSRRRVRIFGPVAMSPAARNVPLVRVSLPAGTVLDLRK
ncbi:MAG: hypothetical protein ACM3NF_06745 [Gemmatimonadota bacterium]